MKVISGISSLVLFLGLLMAGSGFAQPQLGDPKYGPDTASRKECMTNLVVMQDSYKRWKSTQKESDMQSALKGWRYCFTSCPKATKNIYIYGTRILRTIVKNSSGEKKKAYVDTLASNIDQRIKYYGGKASQLGWKGYYIAIYDGSRAMDAYQIMDEAIEAGGTETKDFVLKMYMNLSTKLQAAGAIEAEQTVEDFNKVTAIAEKQLEKAKNKSDREEAEETLEKTEAMFTNSEAANCEVMVDLFQPKYEGTPKDVELLTKITSLLDELDCTDTQLYEDASESLYKESPSSGAAYHLAKLFLKKEIYEKAIEYYKEAVDLEKDSAVAASYAYELGLVYLSQKQNIKAAKMGKKAASLKPDLGDAYIVIGRAYAEGASSVGKDAFHKKAVYWAAVDKFQKAKRVDPSVEENAQKFINAYTSNFPNVEDGHFYGIHEGDSYTVGGWINEVTRARFGN